jgi:hypothetical protein
MEAAMNESQIPQIQPPPLFSQHWIIRELFNITTVAQVVMDQSEDEGDDDEDPETQRQSC